MAVVTHREWIKYTLRALTVGAPPELAKELTRSFRNCEMRSVVFDSRGRPVDVLRGTHFPGGGSRLHLGKSSVEICGAKSSSSGKDRLLDSVWGTAYCGVWLRSPCQ